MNLYDVELKKTIVVAIEAESEEEAICLASQSMEDDPDGTWAKAEPSGVILGSAVIPPPAPLRQFTVLYRIEKIMSPLDQPFGFECWAVDSDHADEQCEKAFPDCAVVWCWEEDGAGKNSYDAALQDYWNSGMPVTESAPSGPDYRTMGEYAADEAHRQRRDALNGDTP